MSRILSKLDQDLAALINAHPFGETLAESARTIAGQLDAGISSRDAASIHRELRETLSELASKEVQGDDEFGDSLSVPTEVRDPEDP